MIIMTDFIGKRGNEFLKSILGQMSDGLWENSSYMERFWHTCEITSDNFIRVSDIRYYITGYFRNVSYHDNGWYGKPKSYVPKFFAKRVYEIVHEFCEDHELCFRDEWKENNSRVCNYFGYHEDFTIGEVKTGYLHLMFLYRELLKAEK